MAETVQQTKPQGVGGRNTTAVERAPITSDGTVRLNELRQDIKSVEIADVDLLIRFADGSNLLIPNGALDALSANAPKVFFRDGGQTTATELVKQAGKATLVTAGNVRIITDQLDTHSLEGGIQEQRELLEGSDALASPVAASANTTAPTPAPPAPAATQGKSVAAGVSSQGGGEGAGAAVDFIPRPSSYVPPSYSKGASPANPETALTSGVPRVDAELLVASEFKVLPSGRSDSPIGSTDKSASAQATFEVIQGTSGNDVLNYNTALAPVGQGAKVLHLDFSSFTDLSSATITFSNTNLTSTLGLSLSGATEVSPGVWQIALTPDILSKGVDLKMIYNLVADGTTATTTDFAITVTAIGDAGKIPYTVNEIVYLSYRDVTATTSDFALTTLDGKTLYVLPARGLGYDIDLGGGNDEIHAGAGADNIRGGAGNDSLYGDAGNDTLEGGTGADLLDGGSGTNTASYASSATGITVALDGSVAGTGDAVGDTFVNIQALQGSAYDDKLIGDSGANTLHGGEGNDILEGRGGGDLLDGGNGINTASYEHSAQGVTASLTDPTLNTNDAAGDTYQNIINLLGSAQADQLIGDGQNNTITGNGGNDTLEGMGGADTLVGSASSTDTASYAHSVAGVTVSLSTTYAYMATGDAAGDSYVSIENLLGSTYADLLIGDANANVLTGNGGGDTLEGLGGADTLVGSVGASDTASYAHAGNGGVAASLTDVSAWNVDPDSAKHVTISGDAAGDVYVSIENLLGSTGNDLLIGDGGINVLTGGDGDDTLEGLGGASDTLIGGAGTNTASYAHASGAVVASLTATSSLVGAAVTITGDAFGDVYSGIQNLLGSSFGDLLVGDSNANVLTGNGGGDTLEGLGGADTLVGSAGYIDTASYAHAASSAGYGITASLAADGIVAVARDWSFQAVTAFGDAVGDRYSSIENLTGSAYRDLLIGDDGDNVIDGGSGDDTLEGLSGADVLIGGLGNNTASYAHAASGVQVSLIDGLVASSGDAAGDTFSNIQNLLGSSHADTLIGNGLDNVLTGNGGGDVLEGMGGADTLVGIVGATDTASYAHANGSVTASLTAVASLGGSAVTLGGDAVGDVYVSIENLQGSNYADLLIGDGNANLLSGGGDNDTLEGLGGADTLDGGTGNNTASYAHAAVAVTAALAGTVTNSGDAGGDIYINIQNLQGSRFADLLIGDGNANILTGNGGGDTLEGLGGADTLIGSAGVTDSASYLHATSGVTASLDASFQYLAVGDAAGDSYTSIENLIGSVYSDTLIGDSGANTLNGNGGGDVLEGLGGADSLVGNAGYTDTASYAHATVGVTATLDSTYLALASGDAAGDTFSSIENLSGSAYADTLIGNQYANVLAGNGGDDILEGLDGADTLDGGGGNNTASYAHSGSGLTASLVANGGSALASGRDWTGIAASGQATGDVYINIQGLLGSAYADTLIGDDGANTLNGGEGSDLLEGLGGADTFYDTGTTGTDTVTYAHATQGVLAALANTPSSAPFSETNDALGDVFYGIENLIGSVYADTLIGNVGANVLTGNGGGDELEGLGGADTLVGTVGYTDTASYTHASAAVVASLTNNASVGQGDAAGDVFVSIENLRGSGYNDVLTGSTGNNTLWGGAGNDTLSGVSAASAAAGLIAAGGNDSLDGEAGDDVIYGGGGNDSILGGDGNDTIYLSLGTDTVNGGNGIDTLDASLLSTVGYRMASVNFPQSTVTLATTGGVNLFDYTTISGIERVVGSSYAENYYLDLGGRTLTTGGGSDTISYFWFQQGTQISGQYLGVSLDGSAGTASLMNTGLGYTWSQDTFDVAAASTGRIYQGTLNGDDYIKGGAGNDTLAGYFGQDTLDGGGGINTWDMTTNGNAAPAGATATLFGGVTQTYVLGSLTAIAGVNATGSYNGAAFDLVTGNTLNANNTYTDAGGNVTAITLTGLPGAITDGISNDILRNLQNVIGTGNNDWIIGDASANAINGGAGNDILEGMAGADTLDGGNSGVDTASYAHSGAAVVASLSVGTFGNVLFTGSANSVVNSGTVTQAADAAGDTLNYITNLIGSDFNDILVGSAGGNYLIGGAGNDTLEGRGGADTLDGGSGSNTASYQNSALGVVASLLTPASNTNDAAGDIYYNIQSLIGSANNDTLIGDGNANTIEGLAGNDYLDGGNGIDTVSYASAAAAVTVNLAGNSASGGAGTDTVLNFENILGSGYNDTLLGNGVSNIINGGAGNDTIDGGTGNVADTLDGGAGNNTVSYASLNGGGGVSVSLALQGSAQNTGNGGSDWLTNFVNLIGSGYDDILRGDNNANTIDGGNGNDLIYAAADGVGDSYIGNNGMDTLSFNDIGSGVYASLVSGVISGATGNDTMSGFEILIGSLYADTLIGTNTTYASGAGTYVNFSNATSGVSLALGATGVAAVASGGAGADSITNFLNVIGSGYDDTLTGNSLDNYIDGGAGNDQLDGAGGIDWVSYASAGSGVTVSLAVTSAQNTAGAGTDTLAHFENLLGSAYNDTLTGDDGNNSIDGGNGNDTIEGGLGTDTLIGNGGTDTVSYAHASGAVVVSLTTNTATGAAGNDSLNGFEAILGSDYNDILTGDGNANTITGGLGDDTIDGGAGNDVLYGGDGNDLIIATLGNDTVDGGNGNDIIQLTATTAPAYSVTGGSGSDAVVLSGLGSSFLVSNLTGVASSGYSASSKVTSVEQLGVRDNVSTALTFTAYDVRNAVGDNSGAASLSVYTDAGDTLVLGSGTTEGHTTNTGLSITFNGNTYTTDTVYTLTTASNTATLHWYS